MEETLKNRHKAKMFVISSKPEKSILTFSTIKAINKDFLISVMILTTNVMLNQGNIHVAIYIFFLSKLLFFGWESAKVNSTGSDSK